MVTGYEHITIDEKTRLHCAVGRRVALCDVIGLRSANNNNMINDWHREFQRPIPAAF